ncbi:unnamed protein product, partial [Didymodactylos carnosus]
MYGRQWMPSPGRNTKGLMTLDWISIPL